MPTITLMIEPKQVIGFLLLANPAAGIEAAALSDGIFTGLPRDPELLSHPLSRFIQSIKNIEQDCRIEKAMDCVEIHINPTAGCTVCVTIDNTGAGSWRLTSAAEQHQGYCEWVKPTSSKT